MEYFSCVARRTRHQTDLYLKNLLHRSKRNRGDAVTSMESHCRKTTETSGPEISSTKGTGRGKRPKLASRVCVPELEFLGIKEKNERKDKNRDEEGGSNSGGFEASQVNMSCESNFVFSEGKNVDCLDDNDDDDIDQVIEVKGSNDSVDEEMGCDLKTARSKMGSEFDLAFDKGKSVDFVFVVDDDDIHQVIEVKGSDDGDDNAGKEVDCDSKTAPSKMGSELDLAFDKGQSVDFVVVVDDDDDEIIEEDGSDENGDKEVDYNSETTRLEVAFHKGKYVDHVVDNNYKVIEVEGSEETGDKEVDCESETLFDNEDVVDDDDDDDDDDDHCEEIEVEESGRNGNKMGGNGLKFNGENAHGVSSRTRSRMGFQKNIEEDNEMISDIDSDNDCLLSSTDSDNDDTDDEDFEGDESEWSASMEMSCSYTEDGGEEDYVNSDTGEEKWVGRERKEKSIQSPLERGEFSGGKIEKKLDADTGISGAGSMKSKKKLYSLSENDDNDGGGNSDGSEGIYREKNESNDDKINGYGADKEECEEKTVGERERRYTKFSKGRRAVGPKDFDVFRVLANSIWAKGEVLEEDLNPSEESEEKAHEQKSNPPAVEESLPLKFTFGVEEPEPIEKSDLEKELDGLWDEFAFALKSSEIGSLGSQVVDNEEIIASENETGSATHCSQGKHKLVLDEEIGLRCLFCSLVKLEIKYIIPPMSKNPFGVSDKKVCSSEGDFSIIEGLQFPSSGGNSADSCSHTKGTVWDIIPGIRKSMYQHQQEGFEFIWKNLAGTIDLDKLKSSDSNGVGGCIISHAPGTGKTRLTIVFLQSYLELFPKCLPVIIAPASMLLTWEEEFRKWNIGIPFHNLNNMEFSGKENVAAVRLFEATRRQNQDKNSIRMVKLYSWSKDKSILGVSYSLYGKLAGEKFKLDRESKKRRKVVLDKESEATRKILLELPGLLVLDEGHTPRNHRSQIWKALSKILTEKRIILSGTPFQNNFGELYNILCLVRPKFAAMIPSRLEKFCQKKKNIVREKWEPMTNSIGKLADDEIEELRGMIAPFVHVHKGSILRESLPGLKDYLLVLNPPQLQKSLVENIQGSYSFEREHKWSLITVHPSLLLDASLSEEEESNIDQDLLERIRLNPNEGVKTRFLMELIKLSQAMNEKVLVFSQFIDPLCLIKDQLSSLFGWKLGEEVLQMHGKITLEHRQYLINNFNDPNSEAKILLASIRACSEGINLVGASRVVLLDVVWNPSVERQAISRAYRLGQKKIVYTYHLIMSGTMEQEKYCKQAEKHRIAELIFSSEDNGNEKQQSSKALKEDKILDEMRCHDKLKDIFERIYQPKEANLIESSLNSVELEHSQQC